MKEPLQSARGGVRPLVSPLLFWPYAVASPSLTGNFVTAPAA